MRAGTGDYERSLNIRGKVLKGANFTVTFIVTAALCLCCVYAAYSLWDNNRIYSAAENVRAELLRMKPDDSLSFDELLAVNPDVCAWLTIDNTNIDYPVVQGESNLSYINTDVYGEFALAGSIYLDSRNARDFSDNYSLLYGHHMKDGSMFGDLDLFKRKDFFKRNKSGTLLLPGRRLELEIFACFQVGASDGNIYEPVRWQEDIDGLLKYVGQNAKHIRKKTVKKLRAAKNPQILAMTTCSSEFTDARTVVLAAIRAKPSERQ